ncbi:MAG TPA: glycosyl hydrolase family 18 protein [Acidothermaceae bacterium]
MRLIRVGAAVAAVVMVTGAARASTPGAAGKVLPAHVFAPYFQSYQDGVSPAALAKASGARYVTMAFLETPGGGSCTPSWNNDPTKPVAWSTYGPDIAKIRALGGDVVPSFGGYSADDEGRELADSCTSVAKIAAAYEKVVTTYGVTRLDLDVEDNSLANIAGIDRRNKAIAEVEAWAASHHRVVQFVYTVPTDSSGIEADVEHILRNAVENHARVDVVNIMTFDYYDNAKHEMASDTMTAADALVSYLHTLCPTCSGDRLWRAVGVTEMIGYDDYGSGGETGPPEIFTLSDAKAVTAWASHKHIAELSFWALNRDKTADPDPSAGCTLGTAGGDTCSGIAQKPWSFTHIMGAF